MFYFSIRKMHFIIMFTLFPELTLALILDEDVVFYKANEIELTGSKRLSAFKINLKPYENFWNKLSEDVVKAGITTHSI